MGTTGGTASLPAAPVFHPTVWGDYFINFIPEPLQARSYISLYFAVNILVLVFIT
jgi:hypothetical protein